LKDVPYNTLIEELHDGMESNVKEINEKILSSISVNYAVEQKKNVLIYFYKSDQVSIHFKALSTFSALQDYFVFVSLSDPSE
jgi:hypothetical protein